ncbi:MAG TPA: hypothetical protein DHU63_03935 [Candidatus Marinimicrobia bacterium]|nr:MAG: hypothetical protein AUJ47_04860 [Candidatus Marinimicrobia bacterium CG1_02_48_14]PIZ69561.1 MAG: hypothetical protein COY19_01730 [Candidatus Marinimicrobia bacterium CG_4_10_14_0_2_um_filter_48_9]HCW75670.1 hypothetical protein [Candidatus Neomarinimicrobiota bacterium]
MMSRRFALQKILDLKELIVESRAVELEKSKQDLNDKQYELESMQYNKSQTLVSNGDIQRSGAVLNPMQLQLSRDYVVQLTAHIEKQVKTVAESSSRVSDQHQALIKVNQEKRALEILRSKHLDEYKKEVQKKERSEESEVALRLQGSHKLSEEDPS